MKRLLMTISAVALATAIPSHIASAAEYCDYNVTTHVVTVNLVGSSISRISRDTDGRIKLGNTWCDAAATVSNTASISVLGDAGTQSLTIDLASGGFRPGFGNEPGTSDEIEFTINLGDDPDALTVVGTGKGDKIDFGQKLEAFVAVRKINLNSGESTHVDADVTYSGVDQLVVLALGGPDVIRARGLRGTGGDPITLKMRVYAGLGDDVVKGGDHPDEIRGDAGKDKVWGFGSADNIHMGDGQGGDIAYGGPAVDTFFGDPGDSFTQ